jgi:hypothetical protein
VWLYRGRKIFASLLPVNDTRRPWSPDIDKHGCIWFEEYPTDPPQEALKGFLFAFYGVYEYWLMTGDERAIPLIQGVLTTIKTRIHEFRAVGEPSQYSAIRDHQPDRYHPIHMCQLLELYRISGDPYFTKVADDFFTDYPPFKIEGDLVIPVGTYTAKKAIEHTLNLMFDEDATTSIPLREDETARVIQRRRIWNRDEAWYYVTSGSLAKYWIKETDEVRLRGAYLGPHLDYGMMFGTRRVFEPARQVAVRSGTYERYDASGLDVMLPVKSTTVIGDAIGACMARQLIDGEDFVHTLLDGETHGAWYRMGDGISLT